MNFFKKSLNLMRKNQRKSLKKNTENIINLTRKYGLLKNNKKKLILGIGIGRSGMRWLTDIFSSHKNAIGSCERNVFAESFYRYVKWNNLPIDTNGIIELVRADIIKDWEHADISLVVSPYFSHDFLNLFNELKSDKVIWAVNNARFTVTSFYNKGWYSEKIIRKDHNLVIGFQPILNEQWNHFFGRIVPIGEFFQEWNSLTRIGKLSWFYNSVNMEIYNLIQKLPREKVWIFKLEEADQNYDYYLKMTEEFGLKPILSQRKFLSLKWKSVRKTDNIRKEWTEQEEKEFEKYSAEFRKIYKNL